MRPALLQRRLSTAGPFCTQVDSVRRELGAEVDQLLEAVQRKSAQLERAESRLSARERWGVAVIQARTEAALKRQVFMWWRCGGCVVRWRAAAWVGVQGRGGQRLRELAGGEAGVVHHS